MGTENKMNKKLDKELGVVQDPLQQEDIMESAA